MGKGGKTTQKTEVKLPPELMEAAKANLQIADEAASIGYTPYTQGEVAGFSPQQLNAMRGVDQTAAFFGMPSQLGKQGGAGMTEAQIYQKLLGMAAPNRNTMGISSFNSMPIYNQALKDMAPGQRAVIDSMVRNPVTGAPATNPAMPAQNFIDATPYAKTPQQKKQFEARRQQYAAAPNKSASAGGSSKLSTQELALASGGKIFLPGYLQMYQKDADAMAASGMSKHDIMRSLQRRYDS